MAGKRKVMIIGLDAAVPTLVAGWMAEGRLPAMAGLAKAGLMGRLLAPFPTITASNWASIATGAWPGTHGVTDYFVHHPGEQLDRIHSGFNTRECSAEYLWNAAERADKISVLLKWPGSWPPTLHSGVQVDGCGPNYMDEVHDICEERLFSTEPDPFYDPVELAETNLWKNVPLSGPAPLEGTIILPTRHGTTKQYFVLLTGERERSYQRLLISRERDYASALAALHQGEWSAWITETFDTPSGTIAGTVRFRLLELSSDGTKVKLYMPQVFPTSGFTYPEDLGPELIQRIGPFIQRTGTAKDRMILDDDEYVEMMEYQHRWFGEAAHYLLGKEDWDIFMMQAHGIDSAQHRYMNAIDILTNRDKAVRDRALGHLGRVYEGADRMIARILERKTDGTLVFVISDHGAKAHIADVPVSDILRRAGLLHEHERENPQSGRKAIDWSRTKAVPQRSIHIYVNLRGRDPSGIVEPGDEYEAVREAIVGALMDYRVPETGECPFALALKREDARILGLYGDRVGDVIYALRPQYGMEHGQHLPTSSFGIGTLEALFIAAGPGVRSGAQVRPTRWLIDIAPTVAWYLGIPAPRDADGSIMHEMFENPDAVPQQIAQLTKERDRWRAAFEGLRSETHDRRHV